MKKIELEEYAFYPALQMPVRIKEHCPSLNEAKCRQRLLWSSRFQNYIVSTQNGTNPRAPTGATAPELQIVRITVQTRLVLSRTTSVERSLSEV